jgi:pyruvate formate lyase activating enzyme
MEDRVRTTGAADVAEPGAANVAKPGASGRVFDVQRFSLHDGPGIRTVVFLKGCPLRCAWCANPESQVPGPQIAWFENLCVSCGRCVEACPRGAIRMDCSRVRTDRRVCMACGACAAACSRGARRLMGHDMTVDEVMAEVRRDAPFFRRSGGGVTFSGGEPLAQPAFLHECLRRCRRWGYHTAVETCGHVRWGDLREAATLTDLFLYDLKEFDSARHQELTGLGNELILENLQKLLESESQVTVRMPVIPGANDGTESLAALADFVGRHPRILGVELLPYHPLGRHKYEALDIQWLDFGRLDPATLEAMAASVSDLAGHASCVVSRGLA